MFEDAESVIATILLEYNPVSFCSIKTNCLAEIIEIIPLSDQANAFAELLLEGNHPCSFCYSNIFNIYYDDNLNNYNTTFTGFFTLSASLTFEQNMIACIEKYNYTNTSDFNYKKDICVDFNENLACTCDNMYDCNSQGYDIYVISIFGETNTKLGKPNEYSLVFCCK